MSYRIVHNDRFIEEVLSHYKTQFGCDYEKYRNHAYRVYNYSLCQLGLATHEELAFAAAFHDLGIWSANTFDYLDASLRCMLNYLERHDYEKLRAISTIIYWHHKRTPYVGVFEEEVEAFRKADLMDVTLGYKNCGIPATVMQEIKRAFPYRSFHFKLVKLSWKNFIRHPGNPLPMFKE
ncbi:Metal-dependent phosphohydrolase [Fulvivirga imtechensis AK7]|uniref:Metal-dependent phosphohydrolase n=1 Tax=Fulvivirga imtechensis AK7 TaxID=1237149 RepID=L8JV94_9BACT|nr:hypothetical protein [Fulvivirga imtechensis]ELR72123.1 Metal-dependent phosphohydrolase [Fulvivirga imtechensis AK7]